MQFSAGGVSDGELVGGTRDSDATLVVQPVVVRTEQHKIGYKSLIYLLLACILPVWRW